jgi:hypothetical protein
MPRFRPLQWAALCALGLLAALSIAVGARPSAASRPAPAAAEATATVTGAAASPASAAAPQKVGAISTTVPSTQGELVPSPVESLVGVESFDGPNAPSGGSEDAHLGTGFVVQLQGLGAWVATAGHVVVGTSAAVFLPGDPTPHLADQIVRDTSADLALLHIPSLIGVAAVQLGEPPASAWAAEIACVRWPQWTYQSYPVALTHGALAVFNGNSGTLETPSLSVLPGCSGGPLLVYSADGAVAVTSGVVIDAITQPLGVGYVPVAEVQSLLADVGGK